MDLKGRSFLKLLDFTPEEIIYLVDLAQDLKEKRKKGIRGNSLKDKNIALIFEKPSTRTRCSFTIGAQEEGALATYLAGSELQLGENCSIFTCSCHQRTVDLVRHCKTDTLLLFSFLTHRIPHVCIQHISAFYYIQLIRYCYGRSCFFRQLTKEKK